MARAEFPDWFVPMAATLTQQRFTGPEWVFERKFDGIRLLAFKRDGEVRLLSRNRLPQNCPPIANAVAALPPADLILDGEMSWRALRAAEGWGPGAHAAFAGACVAGRAAPFLRRPAGAGPGPPPPPRPVPRRAIQSRRWPVPGRGPGRAGKGGKA